MIATFCLRLAAGLMLMLPILPVASIPPRFFRVHFLTGLGLLAVVGVFAREGLGLTFWTIYTLAVLGCLAGSIVWHLAEAPGGRIAIYLTPVILTACLIWDSGLRYTKLSDRWHMADDASSALILGSATTAMLMGHSYLISPSMSISPLMRLLAALGASLMIRIGIACFGIWQWTSSHGVTNLESELMVWLPVRWGLGFLAPLVLTWMAWETARIRSTQSATGILYVVVIFCFLGELTSLLLLEKTGIVM